MENIINLKNPKWLRGETEEEIDAALRKAEDDRENGRYKLAEDVFKEWKEKYEI